LASLAIAFTVIQSMVLRGQLRRINWFLPFTSRNNLVLRSLHLNLHYGFQYSSRLPVYKCCATFDEPGWSPRLSSR